MPAFTPIRTARLLLRDLRESDLAALVPIHADPVFQRYEGQPASEDQTRASLEKSLAEIEKDPRTHYRLAITIPPDDQLVGHIVFWVNNAEIHEWEIGWGVSPHLWGRGIATEAARAILQFAFTAMDVNRVVAFCHAGNTASWRVMENIGMQREGRLRETRWLNGEKFDEYVYAILRSD
jgi:RimJ/RimL family protein N-acetyltransferase